MALRLEDNVMDVSAVSVTGDSSDRIYSASERSYLNTFAPLSVAYDDCLTCNNCGSGDCSSCCTESDD